MNFDESGSTINVYIFNSSGQQIRHLVKNELTGMSDVFFWNGLDEQNRQLPAGIYIIYIDVFNLSGESNRIKKTVVLVRKIN